ncbi:hypothetical protein AAMO2058_000518400 [Amorphochlora amoebiformis]
MGCSRPTRWTLVFVYVVTIFQILRPCQGYITAYSWGSSKQGGDDSTVSGDLREGVLDVVASGDSTSGAFAALKGDGSVVAWGYPQYGGYIDPWIAPYLSSNVSEIVGTPKGFLAHTTNGTVISWGGRSGAADLTRVTAGASNQVIGNECAMAVIMNNGSVQAWGQPSCGIITDAFSSMRSYFHSGNVKLYSNVNTFAALKQDGTVFAWGPTSYGGGYIISSSNVAVVDVFSNDFAYAALKNDSSVEVWGDPYVGGDWKIDNVNAAFSSLTGVKTIFSTGSAFAALLFDGSVATWGKALTGGDSSSVSVQLAFGIVNISSTSTAFAALTTNRTVVAWGTADAGGSIQGSVASLLWNITAITANYGAFAALRADGAVITWGNSASGGVNGIAQEGVLSVHAHPKGTTFAAMKSLGQVVVWGTYSEVPYVDPPASINGYVQRIIPGPHAYVVLDEVTHSPTSTSPTTVTPTQAPSSQSPTSTAPSLCPSSTHPTLNPTTNNPTVSNSPTTCMPSTAPTSHSPTIPTALGLHVSGNMDVIHSPLDAEVAAGAFILHPTIDATVEREVDTNTILLKSSIRSSWAKGYIGVEIWEIKAYDKILRAQLDLEWKDKQCKFQDKDCPILPLTASNDRTCYIEFRAQNLPEGVGNKYAVSWADASGVWRTMKPEFNDTLLTLTTIPLDEGASYGFSDFWDAFSSYLIVTMSLVCFTVGVVVIACLRLCNNRRRKMKYVLDTQGYNTLHGRMGKGKRDDMIDDRRFNTCQCVYIALYASIRVAMTLMRTVSFFVLVFVTINSKHFEVIKQYPTWASERDQQLGHVIDAIENHYTLETARINREYNDISTRCSEQHNVMWAAFEANKTAIREKHDAQFRSPPSTSNQIQEVSSNETCNLGGGAVYETDSIQRFWIDPAKKKDALQVWKLLPTEDENTIISNLTFECSTKDWCKGYSYDRQNNHYYMFEVLPTPHLTGKGPSGVCFASTLNIWPTLDEVQSNLTRLRNEYIEAYQKEVAQDVLYLNKMIDATNSDKNLIDVKLNRMYNEDDTPHYSELNLFLKSKRLNGTVTHEREISTLLTISGLPEKGVEPVLRKVKKFVENESATTGVNKSDEEVEIFNQMAQHAERIQNLTTSIPTLKEFVEFPNWTFPNFGFLPGLIALVVLFDLVWVCIGWIHIALSVAQYVVGIKCQLSDSKVGKPRSWMRFLLCEKCLCCGCMASCYRKIQEIDEMIVRLIWRIFKALMFASLLFVFYVAYYSIDQLVTKDTLAAFGVFGGMTLQQELQRSIRNEEITTNANAKNNIGSTTLTSSLSLTGTRAIADQFVFNQAEKARVDEWNREYCTSASEFVLGHHPLLLSLQSVSTTTFPTTFPNSTSPLAIYSIERNTFGIPVYKISRVQVTWQYLPNNTSPLSSVSLDYDVVLSMSNDSYAFESYASANNSNWFKETLNQARSTTLTTSFNDVKALFVGIIVNNALPGYHLESIQLVGYGPRADFGCPTVKWYALDFKPNKYLGPCHKIDPVLGHTMRVWNRYNWTEAMENAHEPYINAVRNIALSPFAIMIVGIVLYLTLSLIVDVIEWLLMSVGMIRTRRYVEVPVVLAHHPSSGHIQMSNRIPDQIPEIDPDDRKIAINSSTLDTPSGAATSLSLRPSESTPAARVRSRPSAPAERNSETVIV